MRAGFNHQSSSSTTGSHFADLAPEFGADRGLVAHHHDCVGRRQFLKRTEQMIEHRLPRNRVQDLVQVRFHPSTLARGKNDSSYISHVGDMAPNACGLKNHPPRRGA